MLSIGGVIAIQCTTQKLNSTQQPTQGMNMKTINNIGAQGDILLRRIDAVPDGARRIARTDGPVVLAHSESGHNHECEEMVDLWAVDELVSVREVRRQREYVPDGWRRVAD